MAKRLLNKVCLITGTGGSMGRAAALHFAREGAKVVGCDINVERDAETVELVKSAGGSMRSISPCDLTQPAECQRLIDGVITSHGRLNVLYNNAAMAYFAPLETMPDDAWYKTINEELSLVFLLTRAAWPHLKTAGNSSIINIGSVCGHIGYSILPALAHAAAKGGVIAMTRQMAVEGREYGIRANTISPGIIETNQTTALLSDPAWAGPMMGKSMLNRVGKPEEIAAGAVFLASDESSYITGTDIRIDGGMLSW